MRPALGLILLIAAGCGGEATLEPIPPTEIAQDDGADVTDEGPAPIGEPVVGEPEPTVPSADDDAERPVTAIAAGPVRARMSGGDVVLDVEIAPSPAAGGGLSLSSASP